MAGREKGRMQPIRNRAKISEMKHWLLYNKGVKYSFLFDLGINSGLRVSDLLKLKVSDVRNKKVLYLIMEKTEKELAVHLNPYIQSEIVRYIEFKEDKEYLFSSREGVNRPLTRQMISQTFKEAAGALGLEKVNTHTMRKSFGYWYYKEKRDVYFLMKLFGHNTQAQTLQYIGIEDDEIADTLQDFSL